MAWFEQPDGSRAYIFGKQGAERTAEELGVPFLGALPILSALREGGDVGHRAHVRGTKDVVDDLIGVSRRAEASVQADDRVGLS